jgi:NTP pyrophosphatase (non-canonical NTP hydrolase)
MYGEQSFKKGVAPASEADAKVALADEMADVLWVLLALANQTGVDLEAALERNFSKKTQRDADRHRQNDKLQ